jgi:hypothetical protein
VTSTSRSENLLVFLSQHLFADGQPEQGSDLFLPESFDELRLLASSHHVVIRAFRMLHDMASAAGNDSGAARIANEIDREEERIKNALSFLDMIIKTLTSNGYPVVVIKSLDHWPDLGSDLDLYTNAHSADVIRVMGKAFKARLQPRSWGDRLANKWNFIIPGLPEAVEVHVGRLGQTGEQVSLAQGLITRARRLQVADYVFPVAGAEDRLIIATLQRMYRHFYFRLCDIVDTARLIEEHGVDYARLRSLAEASGIWEGVATYLVIVSDYVERYRGEALELPSSVRESARFGGDRLRFGRGFLRIPILPHSARLYTSEMRKLILSGELKGTLRLGLLPALASAAALEYKISGNDKGIW